MCDLTIYHNPRCSKSRQTLELIRSKGVEPEIVLYLEDVPSSGDIADALRMLGMKPMDIIRKNEAEFKEKFSKKDGSEPDVTWSQIQTALADGGVVAMSELRKQRTALLKETDWMSASDYTMTDVWKTYRQALRDLPANNKTASWNGTTLGNVTFPVKPS